MKNQKTDKPKKELNLLFTECTKIYFDWMKNTAGVPAKMDGAQGKAMKYIIAYLKTIDDNEEKIIEAWKVILGNYDRWDNFHKKQLNLTQINSNLINIINSIKNGKSVTSPKSSEQVRAEIGNIE